MTIEQLNLSGYEDRKELLAQRYTKANKSLFVVALPLHLVPTHLPIPNPDEPFEGNRRVNATHAGKFGDYWRENEKWATPPLLLDTMHPLSRDFEPKFSAGGVEFGVLKLPHNSASELEILDGQHRILGWTLASQRIHQDLKRAREGLQTAKQAPDPIGIKHFQAKVDAAEHDLARLRGEYITLEILEGVSVADHKQYFHDIAVNARGITKSVTVSFDKRSVINRVALTLAEGHPMLGGQVDFEKDRILGSNPNFVSGKNLADIVKHVSIGIDGRMTHRRESSFKETSIEQMSSSFFDVLQAAFPELQELADEQLHPIDLRANSLLGSATILRVLAGAFHELAVDTSDEDNPYVTVSGQNLVKDLFESLAPEMHLPISDAWYETGYFPDKSSRAPSSRAQDIRGLTELLARWGKEKTVFAKE